MLRSFLFRRAFSTTAIRPSNIGSSPIHIPQGVTVQVSPKEIDEITSLRTRLNSKRGGKPPINLTQQVQVTGPRGSLSLDLADFVKLDQSHADKINVVVNQPEAKHQRQMWGTTRALVSNSVVGVSEGHIATIKLVGTGFRALMENNTLVLRVGYCVPINIAIPDGITVKLPLPHRIIVEGNDKQQVKLLAATIRSHRKPEPYKGKGVFVDGETIKLKEKKIK